MSDVLEALTAADFRGYFTRDFKYLPTYVNTKTYFLNDVVFYVANFYKCKVESSLGVLPTDTDNWTPVNYDQASYVLDSDISKSFDQAMAYINPAIFESDAIMTAAYYYCTAHYLVMDIRMAEAGLDSRGEGVVSSKSVGSVSTSYSIPETFSRDPQWSYFAQTAYGKKYLSYVLPRVTGRPGIAAGDTTP